MKFNSPFVFISIYALLHSSLSLSADSLADAIKEGKAGLEFRLRSESVDQEVNPGSDVDADLVTLKTRLNYKTGAYKGVSAFLELDDVSDLGDREASDAAAISDPEGTEVNQVYLAYSGIPDSTTIYGRQRIILDNQRFIGGVGFRQNEQTYDSFTFKNASLKNSEIFYSYVSNVNRIFGEDDLVGDVDMSSHLFNASYKFPVGKLTAYYYGLDGEPSAAQLAGAKNFDTWDSDTYGVRFSGTTGENLKISYTAEYATQSDAEDTPLSYDADYYLLEGGITASGITVTLGQEMLGSDDGGYFITPLATLHAFQGWTDQFINAGKGNLAGGIEDTYVSVGTTVSGIKLLAVYHDFQADDSSIAGTSDYGSEVGVLVAKSFGDYGVEMKYADYSADGFSTDTSKLWLTATAKF